MFEGGVLNVVPAVFALDDGVNPHVELKEVGNVAFDLLAGGGVGVEVISLSEEVGAKTFVGVVEDAVLVGVALGGSIFSLELDVPEGGA